MHGPGVNGAQRRGLFALATAVGALVALAIMAGASWSATGSSSARQDEYGKKVTICHHTHSKKHPQVTITVSESAVKAHLKHGDTLGKCTEATKSKKHEKKDDDDDNTSTQSTASTDESSHGSDHGNGHSSGGEAHGNGNSQSQGGSHGHSH